MIPRIDAAALAQGDPEALAQMKQAAEEVGFATVYNTKFTSARMRFAASRASISEVAGRRCPGGAGGVFLRA